MSDDLIRRADAIDAVHGIGRTAISPQEVCNVLAALPSAEATIGDYPNDLISRSALMEYCSNQKSKSIDNNDIARFPSADAVSREDYHNLLTATEDIDRALREYQAREEQASADAVQGEWGHMVADGTDGSHWYEYECSHCGEVVLRPYNYCPNCGAMMVREDGGE